MVSIVIPVYNGEKYIQRCLDSVLGNNPDREKIEVIAINDGSKDSSSAILHEYAEKYPNLNVIDQKNSGAAQARKNGIAAARGDFIAFLDIDDWVEPEMYAAMEQKAVESGAEIVFCNYIEEYPTRSRIIKNKFEKDQKIPMSGKEALVYLHRRQAIFPFPWNKIYRAEVLRTVEFPTGNFVGEDYNMLLQLFEKAERVDYLDLDGYHYALTDNSASRSGYTQSTVWAYEHFQEDYELMRDRHPEMYRDVVNYLIIEYMAIIIAMGRNRTYNKEMIRQIKRFVRRGMLGFLTSKYVSITMKGSAVALTFSYRLLIFVYRILNR